METAYVHYLALADGTLADGLRSIYRDRGWRPTAFPALAVPFLWATDGNVLAAAAGVLVGCLLAWTAYSYGIARQYLTPLPAALAAMLTCTSPELARTATIFYSEVAWIAACTAFVYHALRSEDFKNRWHALAAGIALAAATLIRPAESAAAMALPVAVILLVAVRRNAIGRLDFAAAALQVLITTAVLAAAAFAPYLNRGNIWPLCGVLILVGFFVAHRQRSAGSAGLALFTAAVVALNALWWADAMPPLYSWIQTTSFGTMAQLTDVRMARLGFSGLLSWFGGRFAGPQTVFIVALAVFALTVALARRRTEGPAARHPWILVLIAFGALAPMLVLYGLTGTSEPRRLIAGASLAVLAVAIFAMADGFLHRLRIAAVGMVAIAQLLTIQAAARADIRMMEFLSPWVWTAVPPPQRGADLNRDFVRQLLNAGVPRRSPVAVHTMAPPNRGLRVWEPETAMLASRTLGNPFHLLYTWEIGDYDKVLTYYRGANIWYLLVEHFRDPENSAAHQPYVRFTTALLDRIEAGEVNPPGLELIARFKLGGRVNSLFKIMPESP